MSTGEYRYSSTLSLISALDGVVVQRHTPAALPPGKVTRRLLYTRLGGSHGDLEGCGKSRPPPGFDPMTVQPVASRYTDYGIPGPLSDAVEKDLGGGHGRYPGTPEVLSTKDYTTVTKYLSGDSR